MDNDEGSDESASAFEEFFVRVEPRVRAALTTVIAARNGGAVPRGERPMGSRHASIIVLD